ncbi:MAG: RidA family protein [Dermatophilaceae bacterium]
MVPPVVVYQSAVRDGDRVFTSGQLPMKDGQLMTPGKLGGAVSEEAGYAAARQCRLNALAAITKQVGALSAIKRVVTVIAFMASEPGFTAQPKIANAAFEFLGEVFGAVESGITCWAATSR